MLQERVQSLENQVACAQQKLEASKQYSLTARKAKHDSSSRLSRASVTLVTLAMSSVGEQTLQQPEEATGPTLQIPEKVQHSLSHSQSLSGGSVTTSGTIRGASTHPPATPASSFSAPLAPTSCTSIIPVVSRFSEGRGLPKTSLSSFTHFSSIAWGPCSAALSHQLPSDAQHRGVGSCEEQHFSFAAQVQSYKGQQAQALGGHPSDVCWFVQQLSELKNGQLLSLSSCLGSYSCYLSLVLTYIATFFKCLLFDRELKLYDEGDMEDSEGMQQI